MQATIKINESEFDYAFFKKLKSLFHGAEFEIGINAQNKLHQEDYQKKIDNSIENIEHKTNLIEFSSDEFEVLVAKLSKE